MNAGKAAVWNNNEKKDTKTKKDTVAIALYFFFVQIKS